MNYFYMLGFVFVCWALYSLIKEYGYKKGILFLLILSFIGVFIGLVSEGYFFGEIGRYIFLIILIVIAIIVNNKKYKQYFKMKITKLVENFKKNEK